MYGLKRLNVCMVSMYEILDNFTAWEWKNKSQQERRVFLETLKG